MSGLLDAGFHVILAARNQAKADTAIADLQRQRRLGTAEPLILDLASLDSVRQATAFIASGRTLSVCVLNAGIMALPWTQTVDGFEQQWQVNVLGHFLLCRALLPAMNDESGRVVHLRLGLTSVIRTRSTISAWMKSTAQTRTMIDGWRTDVASWPTSSSRTAGEAIG